MDKRRLKFITWGFVLLTAVIVALMLMSNLRRSSRVELPDTENDAQGSENVPTEGSALTVVEVRPETVQAAIETLHRPQAYRRSVTVEYLWNSDSGNDHGCAEWVDPGGPHTGGRTDSARDYGWNGQLYLV